MQRFPFYLLFILSLTYSCTEPDPSATADFNLAKWQKISLDFEGPNTSEQAEENPFTDYRLDVTFTHDDVTITVPGYFAADGDAGASGADAGNLWRVNFRPDREGEWHWEAILHRGKNIAVSSEAGENVEIANHAGTIWVLPPVSGERGRLVRNHPRYLEWAETGEYFLKGGADSPENFLAYKDFDGTYRHSNEFRDGENKTEGLHHYTAHEKDWEIGNLSWGDGKGKGIVGAVNYLAKTGINSVYFLTMNINGDGKDVWPYTAHNQLDRFDCSKLDQWEMLFDYMDDELGMMLHFVLQETENETLQDNGDTGPQRQLYYRELVARFGHHRAITWNLGEENGLNNWSKATGYQTNAQQAAMAAWFAKHDPYQNYVSIHTHPGKEARRELLSPLLGDGHFGGLSLQIDAPAFCHEATKYWIEASEKTQTSWIATIDEIGPWYRGLDPDERSPLNNQDSVRALVLWGNLMAGGAGVEWYFGAYNPHNDLSMEDWRSRDAAWRWTAAVLQFFREQVPFAEMESHDELVSAGHYCLAKPGNTYLAYLPFGGATTLDLTAASGPLQVTWVNGKTGTTTPGPAVSGGGKVELTAPEAGDYGVLLSE
ncbi:MAG: DUF5060 domain-containing protein [Bacteroidota bacterium]